MTSINSRVYNFGMKNAWEIYHAFNGKLVGTTLMKRHICQTLAKMPTEIIKLVTKNCWFFGSMDDAWAFTFTATI